MKCVAPFSTAQSFIALATTLATSRGTGVPSLTEFFSARYVSFGRRCFIVASLKTIEPKISSTFAINITSRIAFFNAQIILLYAHYVKN